MHVKVQMYCLRTGLSAISPPSHPHTLPYPTFTLTYMCTVPHTSSHPHLLTSLLPPQDPGGQQVGFLLGSLGITVALTSEITARGLPKEEGKDHIVHFKGWPRLTWFVTEHLPKPPKDWTPPQRPQPDTPAYIEVRTHTHTSTHTFVAVPGRNQTLFHCVF